ncbi:MAG: exosome 3'-_5 exonuclease subunit ski4 (Csl4) [Bathelium mastoideum]|nr:MAG: exosome 3'->5 exonuclease subunit ski4 (Csl4) [Bathelium mastoideum]
MATAVTARPALRSSQTQPLVTVACPHCGIAFPHTHDDLASTAQKRIEELESQVKVLTSKATEAVDKLADYEDDLRRLKSATQQNNIRNGTPNNDKVAPRPSSEGTPSSTPDTQNKPTRAQHSRFPSFFNYRRGASTSTTASSTTTTTTTNNPPAPTTATPPTEPSITTAASNNPTTIPGPDPDPDPDLRTLLTRESALRATAERQLSQAQHELEDLTAQLFGQANEMVATERRARAGLEERLVGAEAAAEREKGERLRLQERVQRLEEREGERRGRLERLERAVEQIGRARGVLGGSGG